MKPKKQVKKSQFEMFETRLANLCAKNHPLVVLAGQIEWSVFDEGFGDLHSDSSRPGIPTRVMVGLNQAMKRRLTKRQAVESVIGHMKSGHRMHRNHLKGWKGDCINAILAGCGFNLMKLYRVAALFVRILLLKIMAARADIRQALQLGGGIA